MKKAVLPVCLLVGAISLWFVFPFPLFSQPSSLFSSAEELVLGNKSPSGALQSGQVSNGESSLQASKTTEEESKADTQNAHIPFVESLFPGLSPNGKVNDPPAPSQNGTRHFLSSFKLPTSLTFAGQPVPLDQWQVRERVEFEFYQFLAHEGDNIMIAKRTGRCFPPVEKALAEAGLPDDLKYILLVESKCVAVAYSRARASGPWQFIRSTGKRFKLQSNKWRDERRNLELSTEAATKFLRDLRESMGDWFLAMASYNAGPSKIKKNLKAQKVDDYWKLHYVRETMRYVPRIIAAKEIFSQPEKYLGLTKEDLYAPLETETVTVKVRKRKKHLSQIAQEHDTYFLELKMLNPELKRAYLPRGTYQLKIPKRPQMVSDLPQD